MSETVHERWEQRLDQSVDGQLSASETQALQQHLAECPDCRCERERLERLHQMTAGTVVAVRAGFADEVMARLGRDAPATRPALRPWPLAAAILLTLVAGGVAIAWLSPEIGIGIPLVATLWDFSGTVLAAGAGILAASWLSVGTTVNGWLGASLPSLLLASFAVLALGLGLAVLLRRVPASARDSHRRD